MINPRSPQEHWREFERRRAREEFHAALWECVEGALVLVAFIGACWFLLMLGGVL